MTDTHVIEYGITDAALIELNQRLAGTDAHLDYDAAKTAIKECTTLRTALEAKRKDLKADALAYGRKVDAEARRIREKIEDVENPIKATKQAVDDEAARIEAARVAVLNDKLAALNVTPSYGMSSADLQLLIDRVGAVVVDESFEEQFHTAKGLKADTLATLRAAFAQAVRQEEDAEKLRVMEANQKEEQDRLAKERAEVEEAGRAQREEQERIDREKAQLEADKRADAERKEREQREAAAEAERRDRAEAEEADRVARIEALKPDRVKLLNFADIIDGLKPPRVKTDDAAEVVIGVQAALHNCAEEVRGLVGVMDA